MIDLPALVLDPVYAAFAEPAVLTVGGVSYDLLAIDHTKGITIEDGSSIGVQSIRPAIDVRRSTLTALGLVPENLIGSEVSLEGATWRIKSFLDNGGEIRLILLQAR